MTDGSSDARIQVAEIGLVSRDVTGLGAGRAATVVVDALARCARAMLPWGGEYVVGVCDTAGNLTIQPRSEIETGSPHYVNVRSYGARGDGITYDDDAFQAAFDAMRGLQVNPGSTPAQGPTVGVTLFIPPGTYRLGRPLVITRTCIILGAGGHMEAPATILLFDAGPENYDSRGNLSVGNPASQTADAIVLATDTPHDIRAVSTQIRNLLIHGRDKICYVFPDGVRRCARGIVAHARFHIENVGVYFFPGNGIEAHANVQSPEHSDASCWYIANCVVSRCGGHGFHVHGPDVNAGVAIMLDCRDNQGVGIYDQSFIGNTFVACHTNNNQLGSYKADQVTQHSVFVGCYAEGGQPLPRIEHHSILIGGCIGENCNSDVVGAGLTIRSLTNAATGSITPVEFPVQTGAGTASLTVGGSGGDALGGNYFAFKGPRDYTYTTYFKHSLETLNTSRGGEWAGFHIVHDPTLLVPLPQSRIKVGPGIEKPAGLYPAFPGWRSAGGFRWGSEYNLFALLARQDGRPPGDNSGTFEVGDILFNRWAMESGTPWFGWIGAVCTRAGTAGRYGEGRTATADGSNVVVLNMPSSVLLPGDCILIGGHATRIVSLEGTEMKIGDAVPVGSLLEINYQNPVFTRFGKLEVNERGELLPAP